MYWLKILTPAPPKNPKQTETMVYLTIVTFSPKSGGGAGPAQNRWTSVGPVIPPEYAEYKLRVGMSVFCNNEMGEYSAGGQVCNNEMGEYSTGRHVCNNEMGEYSTGGQVCNNEMGEYSTGGHVCKNEASEYCTKCQGCNSKVLSVCRSGLE